MKLKSFTPNEIESEHGIRNNNVAVVSYTASTIMDNPSRVHFQRTCSLLTIHKVYNRQLPLRCLRIIWSDYVSRIIGRNTTALASLMAVRPPLSSPAPPATEHPRAVIGGRNLEGDDTSSIQVHRSNRDKFIEQGFMFLLYSSSVASPNPGVFSET